MKLFLKSSSCFFAFAMLTFQLHGQMLSPSVDSEPKCHLLFHSEFQKQNNIKRIIGTYSQKRVNEKIIPQKGELTIEFDEDGRLIQLQEIKMLAGRLDTNFTQWNFNNSNTTSTFQSDALSFICTVFKQEGDTIYETAYRTPFLPENMDQLESQDLYWSYEEMCIIEKKEPQRIELYHNSIGLPYKRRTISFNDLGYVIQIEDRLLVTNRIRKTCFEYNNKGQIISRKKYKGQYLIENTEFMFSPSGNLLSWDLFKKDELVKHHEVLYDSKGLVEAIILKHKSTERIEIVQYTYEFYPL